MTDPMPTIMQAAERLRRVHAGLNRKDARELYAEVWPTREDDWVVNAIREDRLNVSNWAIDILPKGGRPVAIPKRPESEHGQSGQLWGVDLDDGEIFTLECGCEGCWPGWFNVEFHYCESACEDALKCERFTRLTGIKIPAATL